MSIRWKPMPAHPGYEINSSGWVRNARGYVVASGSAVTLFIGGARVRLSAPRLREIAAEVFGLPAPSKRSKPGRAAPEASQAEPEHVAEPEPEPAPEALPVPAEAPALVEASTPPAPQKKAPCTRHARSGREFGDRAEMRINPTRELPLRDPWADGRIEVDNQWALQGVM